MEDPSALAWSSQLCCVNSRVGLVRQRIRENLLITDISILLDFIQTMVRKNSVQVLLFQNKTNSLNVTRRKLYSGGLNIFSFERL